MLYCIQDVSVLKKCVKDTKSVAISEIPTLFLHWFTTTPNPVYVENIYDLIKLNIDL